MRTWMLALLGLALAAPACGFSQSQPAPPARAADAAPEVTLQPVDGGPDYYARFVHGLPTDPSYFPIGGQAVHEARVVVRSAVDRLERDLRCRVRRSRGRRRL